MEIRSIEYFVTIVRTGSIAGAAKEIHITQPALSRQIANLETELGKKLFTRGYHGIALTKEGSIFYERAVEILGLIEKAAQDVIYSDSDVTGTVHVGANRPPILRLLSRAAKDIHDAYPKIKFNFVNGNSQTLLESLTQGTVDFIVAGTPMRNDLICRPLPFTSTWGIIAPKDTKWYDYTSITPEDLLQIPLSIVESDFVKSEISGWLGESFHCLNIVSTHTLIRSAVKMSQAGLGFPLCLNTDVDTDVYQNLKFIPLRPWLETSNNIIWKKDHTFSKATELFLKKLDQKICEMDYHTKL